MTRQRGFRGLALVTAQQPSGQVRSLRNLGGASRFTPPVRNIDALRRTMSRPRTQTDIGTVLDEAGLGSVRGEVLKALTGGEVSETTMAPGTNMEWMAYRRGGTRAAVSRNVRWDGRRPLEGFEP
jgi:hypothetical protein